MKKIRKYKGFKIYQNDEKEIKYYGFKVTIMHPAFTKYILSFDDNLKMDTLKDAIEWIKQFLN